MKHLISLSYDLSFQGNYSELYKWLDSKKALECGDSYCRLVYDFKTVEKIESEEDTKVMVKEIRDDLLNAVQFGANDRIYIMADFYVKGKIQMAGMFLVGKRKQENPWDGASGQIDFQQELDA